MTFVLCLRKSCSVPDSNGKELFRHRNAKSFSCVDLTLLNFLLVLRVHPQTHLTFFEESHIIHKHCQFWSSSLC